MTADTTRTTIRERLEEIDRVIAAGPRAASWDQLRIAAPAWYEDGKFGIFIHWGVYSVPAFENEWYPRNMYRVGSPAYEHHRSTYGDQREFGYKDFVPMFTADRFDPEAWARLFRRAGARFVVPVAEHHDGYAMYATDLSRWNAAETGPRRDVVGDLAAAVRAQGLTFGASSHRAEHWWFFNGGQTFPSDVTAPGDLDLYGPAGPEESQPTLEFLDDWLARCCELVDLHQPELVWFDWWIEQPAFEPYLQRFAAYYYTRAAEWGREVAINYKFEAFAPGTAVFDVERGQLARTRPEFWQTDTSVSKSSWCYTEPQDWKRAVDLVADLVDIVSKNGALLLNIGPRADGTIPEEEVELLETIGEWLSVNGEAIYGTRPWIVPGEGPTRVPEGEFTDTAREPFTEHDVRFTTARGDVFATVLGAPTGDEVRIRSLGSDLALLPDEIERVDLLDRSTPLTWTREGDALRITLPAGLPRDLPISFRIRPARVASVARTKDLIADHALLHAQAD